MDNLIIIGCGPGGYSTAEYAAKAGMNVTIFEKDEVGGTCLNRGCIPTKVYCYIATTLLEAQQIASHGVAFPNPYTMTFSKANEHKNDVVAQLRSGVETLMSQPGITLVRGEAKIKDCNTVTCNGNDYTADNIIIATGSHPSAPPIEGLDNPNVVDSTGLLDLKELPEKLVIVGAGVIGMEMASAFAAFGSEVTMIEFLKECLPMADSDLAKRLRKLLEKRGIKFYLQSAAKKVEGNTVTFEQKGKTLTAEADTVLIATGREPNTNGLGLSELGVEFNRHGIDTGNHFETNIKGVYAIGDVNGKIQLAHAAEAQGKVVVDHILGRENHIRLDLTPWAVFTTPELAGIGPTEAQLKSAGVKYNTRKTFYRANGKAVAMDATDGLVKIIYADGGRILGCHILGAHAADLVQEITALMNMGTTMDNLDDVIHIHPTLQELL